MTQLTSANDFSRKAVESFVQTVVFVDDKIYSATGAATREVKRLAIPVKRRKAVSKSANKEENQQENIPQADSTEEPQYSPYDIQASFAKKSIVCSLHQPPRQNSVGTGSDTYKLCASADIIIVDWDLYGDAGKKAQELVENLVVQSLEDDPHQLRLVLIYTDNPNLFSVANSLFVRLASEIDSDIDYPEADQGLAFHTMNARVVVLGKPAHRAADVVPFEVEESKLADRAIEEFSKLANGLLQGCILVGLAEIRKQSRKILTKFHSGLDAAFLTHRALGLPHEEAFDHVSSLLVSEIEAVLEDGLARPLINEDVLGDWVDVVWVPTQHAFTFVPEEVDVRVFSKSFCRSGIGLAEEYQPGNGTGLQKTVKSLRKNRRWPSSDTEEFKSLTTFLSTSQSGDDQRELAMLMGLRTYYGEEHRLTLGTVIREKTGEERYLLCLQPPCDSVRLKEPTVFMFCALDVSSGGKLTHVVRDGDMYVDLLYKQRVEKGLTVKFRPKAGREFVMANGGVFTDMSRKKYAWVTQLKPKHAQRAVEEFARNLTRVGLTESEWLRLKAR